MKLKCYKKPTYRTVQSLFDHDWLPLSKELGAPCLKLQSLGWSIWQVSDEGEATLQSGQWLDVHNLQCQE